MGEKIAAMESGHQEARQASPGGAGRWEFWAGICLAVVLVAGVTLRGMVIFGAALPRGINGGYYPVQVRAILRSGSLAIPDLPLLFYLQALAALPLRLFCADRDSAILLATRLTDTVLPCLAAIPLYLLARAWVPRERRANLPVVVLVAGLAAIANPIALRMAGDLQKNSAALGLSLLFVVCADSFLRRHRPLAAVGALGALLLTGLTHIGVFGMTLLLGFLLALLGLGERRNRRWLLLALPAAAVVAVLAAVVVFVFFDATRIERLTGYILSPLRLFRAAGPWRARGPGPMPGPGGMPLLRPETVPGLLLGGMGVWMWLLILDVDRVQRQTVLACALAALGLACPFLSPDMGGRLALMAFLPGVVCLVFALAHWPRPWSCAAAGALVTSVALAGDLRMVRNGTPGAIGNDTRADLIDLARQIDNPRRTLIVARHGLEWWTAWYTGADIANNLPAALPVWENYDQVLSAVETDWTRAPGPMGAPMPGGGGPGPGPGLTGPGGGGSRLRQGPFRPGLPGGGADAAPDFPAMASREPSRSIRQSFSPEGTRSPPTAARRGAPTGPGLPGGPDAPPFDADLLRLFEETFGNREGTHPHVPRPAGRMGPGIPSAPDALMGFGAAPGGPGRRGPGPGGMGTVPTETVFRGRTLVVERFLGKPPEWAPPRDRNARP
ncbi:MAG: hypothetical protein JXR77_08890 [Lentisphaeria bacterium]|nr:hypothetical protein [Lentisphaeria bacterium]